METATENKPILGKGARIWLILCIIVNTALIVYNLILFDFDELSTLIYLWFPIVIGVIAGYVVMLTGRRIGLVLLAVCALLSIINTAFFGLFDFQTIATAVLNIGITIMIVGRSWNRMKPLAKSALTIIISVVLIILAGLTVTFGVLNLSGPSVRYDYDGRLELRDESGTLILQHNDFVTAKAIKNEGSGADYNVQLILTSDGREKFRRASRENIGRRLNIFIGDFIVFSPIVDREIDSEYIVIALSSHDDGRAFAKCMNDNIKRYG